MEAFEERMGVRLDALYAHVNGSSGWTVNGSFIPGITVNGEVHSRDGTSLPQSIEVVADAYDRSGRLIKTGNEEIDAETFYGFETFSLLTGGIPPGEIAKIRVYPKRRRW